MSREIRIVALVQAFRRMEIWRRAHALALEVRKGTRFYPRPDFTSLKTQTVRAAESIPFNMVEGSGAYSLREFARFLEISIKSTCELEYQLQVGHDTRVLRTTVWRRLSAETVEIRRMTCAYRKTLLERDQESKKRSAKVRAPKTTDSTDQLETNDLNPS